MNFDLEKELGVKGWEQTAENEFTQETEGYRPYYLYHDGEKWRLCQWGLALALGTWEEITEDVLVEIFRLCSQYAKPTPW